MQRSRESHQESHQCAPIAPSHHVWDTHARAWNARARANTLRNLFIYLFSITYERVCARVGVVCSCVPYPLVRGAHGAHWCDSRLLSLV
jgi:hypothetical protein